MLSASSTALPASLDAPATTHTGSPVRVYNWDRLRLLAAADIVGFHVTGAHGLFGFGLPIFLMLAVALAASKPSTGSTATFVRRRMRALMLPWAFWSMAVTGLEVLGAIANGRPAFGWAEPAMLLYGPMSHFWFLPFVAVAAVAAHGVQRARQGHESKHDPMIAFGLGGLAVAIYPALDLPAPASQWLFALPALLVGYGIGRLMAHHRDLGARRFHMMTGIAVFATLALLVGALSPGAAAYAIRYLGGTALVLGAALLPNVAPRGVASLASLMLGVYLLHPLIYELGISRVLPDPDAPVIAVVATMVLTMGLVHLLRRTPLRRFV